MSTFGSAAPQVRLATLFYEIESRTSGLDADLDKAKGSLGKLSQFIKDNPVAAMAGLGLAASGAAAALVSASVQAAAQFESEMAKVSTVANTNKEGMDRLADAVGDLFKKYPVGDTKTLTDGLYQILSSGISASDAMKVLDVSTRTAIGGFTSTEQVVDALTSILNAYKDKNLDAGQTADVLARAVADGKIEMGELSSSIGNVVGIAATFGTSIEDVSAVLVQLSLNGVKTAEGVTGLRSAIVNIIRPASEFTNEFPKLSAAFDENRLRRDGFIKFLTDFQKETGGSSEALKSLFRDTQGYNAVVSLLKDGGAALVAEQERMAQSAGAVDAAFNKVNVTTEAQYQLVKNNLSSVFRELGEQVLPVVVSLLSGVLHFLERISGQAAQTEALNNVDVLMGKLQQVTAASTQSSAALKSQWGDAAREALKFVNDLESGRLKLEEFNKTKLTDLSGQFLALSQSPLATEFMQNRFGQVAQAAANLASQMKDTGTAVTGVTPPVVQLGNVLTGVDKNAGKAEKSAAKLRKELQKGAEAAAEAAADALQAYEKKRQSVIDRLTDATVSATKTMVDDMQLALARAVADLRELGATEEEVGQFTKLRQGAIAAQQNIERVGEQITQLKNAPRDSAVLLNAAFTRTNELLAEQHAIRNRPGVTDAERVAAEQHIKELTELRTELEKGIAENRAHTADSTKTMSEAEQAALDASLKNLSAIRDRAALIGQTATGLLKMAQSSGLLNASLSETLQDIIQIGAQTVSLVTSVQSVLKEAAAGALKGGTIGAAIASAGALVGTVVGMFQKDAAERKAREATLANNTKALLALTKVNGDLLRLQVSGKDFSQQRDALASFLGRFSNVGDFREFGKKGLTGVDPARELEKMGLSFEQLKEIAKTFGITLDGQIGSYRRLLEAMRAADLAGFADTFSGALEQLDQAFEINAEKFPTAAAKLQGLVGLLNDPKKGAPALFAAFNNLDLSTIDGQQKALGEVQKLFARLSDPNGFTAEDLGNLSLAEFKQIVARLNSEIRGLGDALPPADTTTAPTGGSASGASAPAPTPAPTPAPSEPVSAQWETLVASLLEGAQQLTSALTELSSAITMLLDAIPQAGVTPPDVARLTAASAQLSLALPPDVLDALREPRALHFTLEVTGGVVVGSLEELVRQAMGLMVSELNTALGRELSREVFVTGDRAVVVR